ncbi:MAG: calcium/sodium antiporter [Thermoanaerobaculia bacterium]|nr:calcium/sodium antiporter [Thermoanaerobaculia bacterium]
MSLLSFSLVALGIVLLYGGGEALVRGAVDLARTLGLSSMVIGLTVVAFATSAPELAATLMATLQDAPDLAIGNALGSNVANLGLILGVAAWVAPLQAKAQFLKREIPLMLGATLVLYPIMGDGVVGRVEGGVLVLMLAGYLYVLLTESAPIAVHVEFHSQADRKASQRSVVKASVLVAGGVGLLVLGAWSLVTGAVQIALAMGLPERVVGLTMVALGTSLPELASSIVAARRKEGDIVLGNIIGSNVFNILCILGITSMVRPIPVSAEALRVDYWVVLAFSVVIIPLLLPRLRLARWEGAILVVLYCGYMAWLFTG